MEVCDEALGVTPGRTTSSADLGGKPPLSFYISPSPQMGVRVSERSESENVDITKNIIAHIEVNHMSTSGYAEQV